jgi:hypothetical protein
MWILWLRLGVTVLVLLFSVTSGQAVTCEEVRRLTPTKLAFWAKRLQVSPTYLTELLDKAFCNLESDRQRIVDPDYNRGSLKAL